jgi:DUF1009 family protein
VLAIEAGRTILLDEQQFLDFADHHRIAVIAIDRAHQQQAAA